MPGGLLQLISYGQANIIFTRNPETTFFKTSYKKYTPFGMQRFRIDYDGQRILSFDAKSEMEFKIPRFADMLWDTYIVINLPDIWSPLYYRSDISGNYLPFEFKWVNDLGFALIDRITIHSGGATLAQYSGEWMMNAIRRDEWTKRTLLGNMVGSDKVAKDLVDPASFHGGKYPNAIYRDGCASTGLEPSIRGRKLYIPLMAWFTHSTKTAIPLIALQYQELHVKIEFNAIKELFTILDVEQTESPTLNNFELNLKRKSPNPVSLTDQMWRFLQPPSSLPSNSEENNSIYSQSMRRNDWNADIHLLGTYIFLDNNERRIVAKRNHSILIKQQYEWDYFNVTGSRRVDIPSKDMVASYMWRFRRSDVGDRNEWFNYSNYEWDGVNPNDPELLKLSDGTAFVQPFDNPLMLYSSGCRSSENIKNIMIDMAILCGQDYRENVLPAGVYAYIEKLWRTTGSAKYGLYCYNFSTNTNRTNYQPTGAQNTNKWKYITFEFNTIEPPKNDDSDSLVDVLCDENGEVIGVRKDVWNLNKYNYDLRVFEERYNVIEITGGRIGLMYAR
jgi:hypothetical protein